MLSIRWCLACVLAAPLMLGSAAAQLVPDPFVAMDRAMAAAEASVRIGEYESAESHYRAALLDGWIVAGGLHVAAGRLPNARDAFLRASGSAVRADRAFRSLALVHLQMGNAAEAIAILTQLASRGSGDLDSRRLLAHALAANGQRAEAVQTLEEAHAAAPDDPEIAFLLGSGYLQLKKIDAAERLFAVVAAARPIPQTWVLIGRTYRDAGFYDRARTALATSLKKDPRTRRAHYYLGTLALLADGVGRIEDAIAEFRAELKLAPDDPPANLRLGMALVEARRPKEALPSLQLAARTTSSAEAFHYLGRCQLELDRADEAIAALRRALELAQAAGDEGLRARNIHYQLAIALRRTGAANEAAVHFDAAKQASVRRAEIDREQLGRYLADVNPEATQSIALETPYLSLAPDARAAIERRVTTSLARAYLNLGVMRAQAQQFERAAGFFAHAAEVDPDFPQVQYSLGVAHFNAQQFDKATAPLARAMAADPRDPGIRRMLALAHLNAGAYADAAKLLGDDPARASDPSLQYAYGLALVRSDRAGEAEAVFSRLLAEHGANAELHVILGQAHAQQGDYDAAARSLERALQLKPDVADAHAALGLMYMKQGKLADAAASLREELRVNPANLTARHTLATVLDLDGKPIEAAALLRDVLRRKPDFGDARYLLGKILLGQGDAEAAIAHLEAAVRLAPEDATYHYQLAQAYVKAGRRELADRHFAVFRELKDKRRGGGQAP